jgi:2,3-bisphosphoglycerate-independent phosphoglycerate mutase
MELADALGTEEVRFHPGVNYRHILVVKGRPDLLDLAYTPPHDIPGAPVARAVPSGPGAEFLLGLMERARPVLAASHVNRSRLVAGEPPATDIWPFWPGTAPKGLVPFCELRGVAAALTSGVDLLGGLAVLTGIDRLDIPGVTDGADNDYVAQAEGGLAALADHDLVVIHVETPDEEGHAGHMEGKIAGIEAIDREIVGRAMRVPGPVRILCMPDHPTPIALKTHTDAPVPFVLSGDGVAADAATVFSENSAEETGLLLDPGRHVMDLLLRP